MSSGKDPIVADDGTATEETVSVCAHVTSPWEFVKLGGLTSDDSFVPGSTVAVATFWRWVSSITSIGGLGYLDLAAESVSPSVSTGIAVIALEDNCQLVGTRWS
jgi:hypothetical protein